MPTLDLPELPASYKCIQHYLKIALEHDARDPVVSYWARLYALQTALGISKKKSPEETNFLIKLMNWLEATKKELHDNEAITNEVAAQAHLENWALKLFLYADKNDRAGNFNKSVIQSFYTAGMLYDVLTTFGDLNDESVQNRKYAKWKASYIHNCLKNGGTPIPGPIDQETSDISLPKPDDNADITEIDSNADDEQENKDVEETAENEPEGEPNDNEVPEPPEQEQKADEGVEDEDINSRPENSDDFPSVPSNMNSGDTPSTPAPSSIPPFPTLPSSDDTINNSIPTPTTPQPRVDYSSSSQSGNTDLSSDQMLKAQKYIKWAGSAINYEDVPTAVENLQKALRLLTTGQDS